MFDLSLRCFSKSGVVRTKCFTDISPLDINQRQSWWLTSDRGRNQATFYPIRCWCIMAHGPMIRRMCAGIWKSVYKIWRHWDRRPALSVLTSPNWKSLRLGYAVNHSQTLGDSKPKNSRKITHRELSLCAFSEFHDVRHGSYSQIRACSLSTFLPDHSIWGTRAWAAANIGVESWWFFVDHIVVSVQLWCFDFQAGNCIKLPLLLVKVVHLSCNVFLAQEQGGLSASHGLTGWCLACLFGILCPGHETCRAVHLHMKSVLRKV